MYYLYNMTEEERMWQLSRLLDWADKYRYEIPGERTRIEPVVPSDLYGLCYNCTDLLYELCKIDDRLITKLSWGMSGGLSSLNFITLENAGPEINNIENPTKTIFWGTVLDVAYSGYYGHAVKQYENFCRAIAEACNLDKDDEYWELGGEGWDEQDEINEKWRQEKQGECRDFLQCTRTLEGAMRDSIFQALKSCDVNNYPVVRCQLITCLLKQFRDNFISNAVVAGPYILNFGGLWEKDFAEDKGQASGHLWIDFSNLWNNYELKRVGAKCRFRPGDQHIWFEWEQPILVEFPINYSQLEERLFETWAYDSGQFVLCPTEGSVAQWVVNKYHCYSFETKAREMEELAAPLCRLPPYRELIDKLVKLIAKGQREWKPCHLEWTYVKQLHELVNELELVYQEWQAKTSEPRSLEEGKELRRKEQTDTFPAGRKERTRTWKQLVVEVVDDETLKYKIGDEKCNRAHYIELGFADKRTKLPNKLWDILLSLATPKGTSKLARPRITPKDIDRIRETLRTFFNIKSLPITYDKQAKEYRCNFSFTEPRDW